MEGINATVLCEKEAKLALFLAVFGYDIPKQTKRRFGQLVRWIFLDAAKQEAEMDPGNISCSECVDSEDQIPVGTVRVVLKNEPYIDINNYLRFSWELQYSIICDMTIK